MKMNNRHYLALVALMTIGTAAVPLQAQAPHGSVPAPTPVLVVDIAKIFKTSPTFTSQMANIKKEVTATESEIKVTQQQIKSLQEQLNAFNPGTLEHQNAEGKLARTVSDLQVKMGLKRKAIVTKEAKIYYATYQEVTSIVAAIAHQKGAGVVLNYSGDKMDSNDRASIIKGVNRSVVFQNPNVDVTDWVLAAA